MVEKGNAIQPTTNRLLPIAGPEKAREAYQAYLELCQSVLIPYDDRIVDKDGVVRQESDYSRISQRKKVEGRWITEYVDAPRKSAWRKLARFYGVSTEILEKQRTVDENSAVTWHYTVRAWEGDVTTMGEGACSTKERGKERTEHEAKGTAHTRAKNRAISDLIGFGQVSAEEMTPEAPRKQVDAEVKVKPKKEQKKKSTKKKTKKEKEDEWFTPAEPPKPQTTLKPEVTEIEEKVLDVLKANDVDVSHIMVMKYGDTVRIVPQEDYDQIRWIDDHRVITEQLKGAWNNEHSRWEVPPP